jgi:hypothetical protein
LDGQTISILQEWPRQRRTAAGIVKADQQTGQSIKSNQVKSKQIESINKSRRDNQSNPAQSSQVNQYHNHQFNSGVISSRHQAHSQTIKTTCRIINKTVNTENA